MTSTLPAIVQLREELSPMRQDFANVLASHIPADKFIQVCLTAVENNPDLLNADRQSFKVACLNAANDGLLPDKREGALVIFNTEVSVKRPNSNATYKERRQLVQWMPMVRGILKVAYNTGLVESISVELVYENDQYSRAAGDDAKIIHIPEDFGDRGAVKGGYSIVKMRTGGVYHEVMSLKQIQAVQAVSRAENGPWKTFWEEMARKTILRRGLKKVPLSTEVDQVLARDEVFFKLDEGRNQALLAGGEAGPPKAALFSGKVAVGRKKKAAAPKADEPVIEGEVVDPPPAEPPPAKEKAKPKPKSKAKAAPEPKTEEKAFVFRAVLTKRNGVQEFKDVDMWRGDLEQRMRNLQDDDTATKAKFWELNSPHIEHAGKNGFAAEAGRLLARAQELGFTDAAA